MFSLSARFRKSRTAGVPGSVYYVIRKGKEERDITGRVRGMDESVMTEEKARIAFDLMTVYCVIETRIADNNDATLDVIADAAAKAILEHNPYEERLRLYDGKYPIDNNVAGISKLFSAFFIHEKKPPTDFDKSTLQGYISSLIQEYVSEGKPYSKSLRSTRRSLDGYLDGKDICIKDVTERFITDYKAYLDHRVTPVTASFYLRNLRTALIRAEREQLLSPDYSWPEAIKTNMPRSNMKTLPTGLDINIIRMIERMDLSSDPTLRLARDMFMFGFYNRGMELIDIAMLRKENLVGNTLTYRRRQKGKERTITLGDRSMSIVRKYSDNDKEYLFPIIQRKWMYSYTTARTEIADSLTKIGRMLTPPQKLTFSMNIHSWESIIKQTNIAEALIS